MKKTTLVVGERVKEMYSHDENSGPSIRKGKRRSSILKVPKSPGCALDDIDPNTENVDENDGRSKKARRSSSRRVSFAEKCQIKEIPNEVLEKMSQDEFAINEDNSVPPSFLNLESTRDNSMYRQPAPTLAGLPSLLTSPIQECPDRQSIPQLSSDHDENQLNFTCYQPNSGVQDNANKTQDAMELTKNYQGWELEQSTVLTSRYSISNKCSEDDGQLDFTRTHGVFNIQDNQPNITVPEDMMEMTKNYEGWEFEQSTVLTRQVVASKVAISNQGQMSKPSALNFLNQLQANEPNESFGGRNSYDTVQTSRAAQSPKRNGASFLNKLRSNDNPSFQPQQPRAMYNNRSFPVEALPTTLPMMASTVQSPVRDGSSFLSQLNASSNSSSYQQQENSFNNNPAFTNAPPSHCATMYIPEKDDDLEFTCCQSGNIDSSQFLTVDEDITVNMEMTTIYENRQLERPNQNLKIPKNDSLHLVNKHSPEKDDNYLEFTRCHGRIEKSGDGDVEGNEMEMTRINEKSIVVSVSTNECNVRVGNKHTPDKENLDFTRCLPGNIFETSKIQDVDEDVRANQMEMTRIYENREREKSTVLSVQQEASKNVDKLVEKVAEDVAPHRVGEILDHTANKTFDAVNALRPSDIQTSVAMMNASKLEEMSGNQSASVNVSRLGKLSKIQTPTAKADSSRLQRENETYLPKVARHENISESQKSILDSEKPLETLEDQTKLVKAIPRATSSKITMDNNFKRFEIKMPTSKVSKVSVFKSEEIPPEVKSEEKFPGIKSEEKFPGMKSEEKFPGIESEEKFLGLESGEKVSGIKTGEKSTGIKSEEKSVSLKSEEIFPGIKSEESKPGIDGQEPWSCPQELSCTKKLSKEDMNRNEKYLDMETLQTVDAKNQENGVSTTNMNVSPKLIHSNDTATETEDIETDGSKFRNETIPEEKAAEKPYTLREFMADAGISFLQYKTRRSETPMLKCDVPKELKDKIYSRCLSEAKLQIMEDFALQLQQEIIENEKLFSAKEKELNENNPPVFAKLKKVLGTEDEDLVVDEIKQLKRTGDTRGKRLWYEKKTEMNNNILASLQEQEKNVLSDLTLLNNHKSDLDEDINMLDKLEADCDRQIQELEGTLESEEKEWAEFVTDTNELKEKLEKLELELKSKEEQRTSLSSVTETLRSEIGEQKRKMTDVQSVIQKLEEDKALRDLKDKEMLKLLPFQTALQEWVLEIYDKTKFKFSFLGRTLDLDVTFEDEEKIKDIQLISEISETSVPLAILGHSLVMEEFAHYDFVAMFPTRKKLRQLLNELSLACIRVRIVLETMSDFSINHFVSVNGKILTVEFSSLAKFLKFVINFDLSKLVADGNIPFTVIRKIGATSAEAISEELNKFPSTVLYFSKILKAADEMMR